MKQIEGVNDFVAKFANVNGTGSASANHLFAKAIFRMGIPVSPRNIFPSTIQGLPTWYEVRVNEAGYIGRRGGVDLMVAMNPQTWDQDVASIDIFGSDREYTGEDGGMGGMAHDDCSRICESPCVEEVIPGGMVDDCINACRMGSFMCIPELIAALECIEMIDCDIVADPCIAQSTALTICLAG